MASWRFVHFLVNAVPIAGPSTTLTILEATTIEAVWEEIAPTHTLTITSALGGSTSPLPGAYNFDEGVMITGSAQPQADYKFDGWIRDGALDLANPITILMDADHILQPTFSPLSGNYFTLTIGASGPGTVSPSPGSYNLTPGSAITVMAFPDPGENQFDGWMLDGSQVTVNPMTVIMNADHFLTAAFSAIPQDTLQQTIGEYQIWLSATFGDYYVTGTGMPEPPRFPTLDDAIAWVMDFLQTNWAPIAVGAAAGLVFLYWLFTRKG